MPVKVLVVSHSYVVAVNQKKLGLLAAMPGLSLALAVPTMWQDMGRKLPLQKAVDLKYRIYPVAVYGYNHLYMFWFDWLQLWRVFRRERPDVVYLEEEPQSVSAWQTVLMAKWSGAKVLLLTWENLTIRFPLYKRLIARWVLARIDAVVGGTGAARDTIQSLGFRGPGFVNPQFGIDEQEFKPRDESDLRRQLGLDGRFTIGFIARLTREKGPLSLLRAVAMLDFDYRLLIVGDGPAKDEARALAAELGIADKVVWGGIIRHDQLSRYMNCMDVFVLPSIPGANWKEQFGHVVIEAMACTVPVIGSDCGAIPELIGDGGLVFPAGEPAALARCLQLLHADRALRIDLGNKGRRRAVGEYSNDIVAARLAGFLRELTGVA